MALAGSGSPAPLGVTLVRGGINVAVVSRHATNMYFCLFRDGGETRFELASREGDVFFGFVDHVAPGELYGLRADGPYDGRAQLFDVSKLLIDPYARQLERCFVWHEDFAASGIDTGGTAPKCVVTPPEPAVFALPQAFPRFIYEVQVKAYSKLNPDIPKDMRGTVAALAHPASIAHFKKLGVDTLELMPVMAWADERHLARLGLSNAWGYNPISFFAPDPRLAPGGLHEIREAVATLHDAGLRVILDVVYNHSGESDLGGPTVALRGLDNSLYYAHQDGALVNHTGCGNTLAVREGPVAALILDSMRHWARATGIDGFRYDLAPILGRGPEGYSASAPLLQAINSDPLLGSLVHIAEPWDVGPGGYQLGNFPQSWREWNDRYRDDVRHFWRGDANALNNFATRLTGSSDIFARGGRKPSNSVNFVSAHDGFTLLDFVTHDHKNNFANGEDNRDGNAGEASWISSNSKQDAKALLSTLFLSRGTILLTAGDEFGRSQRGNNNAYAQDNETTWLPWTEADQDLINHVVKIASFRTENEGYFANRFLTGKAFSGHNTADIEWLDAKGCSLDWNGSKPDIFGIMLASEHRRERLLIWFNRSHRAAHVSLPAAQHGFTWAEDITTCQPRSVTTVLEVTVKKRLSLAPDDATIHALTEAAGIQSEWWELSGARHQVGLETKRALLSAMAFPMDTLAEARVSTEKLLRVSDFPKFTVVQPGKPHELALKPVPGRKSYVLCGKDRKSWEIIAREGESRILLPPLEIGCYSLSEEKRPNEACCLVVTSGRCHDAEILREGNRVFGLTSHLYALRHASDFGIGDFETLARFCESTASLGGELVGINPLHHMFTDDRTRVSPYQPSDRRFIDPIYIDVTGMGDEDCDPMLQLAPHVDYEKVWLAKDRILRKQFEKERGRAAFQVFVTAGGKALQRHAQFEALRDKTRFEYAMWLQHVADTQLAAAAKRGHDSGLALGIYRDLALGCAYEGGEVWSQPALYCEAVSIGAPPDPFSRDGQVWNLPPFNPHVLEDTGYEAFSEILRANMRHAGVLRIDHVLGFARQFWVPRGASGAEGAYVTLPQDRFMALTALESERSKCVVVGEDLGTVPDGLRANMERAHVASYRVLWFEQDQSRFFPPEQYAPYAAACLSSHDLAPFKAWQQTADQGDIAKLERAIDLADLATGDLLADAHAFVAASPCSIMLVQADDLTEEVEPLNVPGTDKERPNWCRRLSVDVDHLADLATSQRVRAAIQKTRQGKNE